MIDQQPILIAGPPRCGTTMLAGLIMSLEDVWVGRARTTMYPGSNPEIATENLDIKDIMKREARNLHYLNWKVPLPQHPEQWNGVKEEIEQLVSADTKWLVKTSWTLILYKFWMDAYPNALWIFPIRGERSIVKSMKRHPGMRRRSDKQQRSFVKALQERQDLVRSSVKNYTDVDVFKVSNGDESEIQSFLNFISIPVDKAKINKWIEPGRMKN